MASRPQEPDAGGRTRAMARPGGRRHRTRRQMLQAPRGHTRKRTGTGPVSANSVSTSSFSGARSQRLRLNELGLNELGLNELGPGNSLARSQEPPLPADMSPPPPPPYGKDPYWGRG
jgi:hypothetical protein